MTGLALYVSLVRPSSSDCITQKVGFVDLRVCSVNVETLRGKPREIADMLEVRSLGIYCVQETRFKKKLIRMISLKAAEYKLF